MSDFLLGDVIVRPRLNQIEIASDSERLPARFIDVLVALAERPGAVWPKNELIDRVWGDPMVGDEALSHAIWVLRKALRDNARQPRFIETIPRRGYRLLLTPAILDVSPVEIVNPAADAGTPATPDIAESRGKDPEIATRPPVAAHRGSRLVALLLVLAAVCVFALGMQFRPESDASGRGTAVVRTGASITSLTADADGVLIGSEDGFLYAASDDGSERWRMPLRARWFSPPDVSAQTLYVGSSDGHVYAFERRTGREIWRSRIDRNVRATPLSFSDRVIVGDTAGGVHALARDDGRVLWQQRFEAGDIVGTLLAFGERVVLSVENGDVLALDSTDGHTLWRQSFAASVSDLVATADGRLLLTCESGLVVALDVSDGHRVWQFALDGAGTRPVVDSESVYAVGRYGTAVALGVDDGQLRWQQQLEAGDRIDPELWGKYLVIGLADHRLGLLNRGDGVLQHTFALSSAPTGLVGIGRALWVATAGNRAFRIDFDKFGPGATALRIADDGHVVKGTAPAGSPGVIESLRPDAHLPTVRWRSRVIGNAQDAIVAPDGVAYVGDERGVSAVDSQGRIRWRFALSEATGTAPVIVGSRLLFGSRDHHIYALDRDTGQMAWRFATQADVIATPVVLGGRVFVGSTDHRMYALSVSDGSLLWSVQVQGPVNGAAAASGERVIFGSGDGHVYALSADVGREIWRFRARDWVVAQPLISDERVLVGVANGDFHALALDSGAELWRFQSDGKVWFTPAVSGDLVYFGSGDGHVYALAQSTGRERWRFRTGAGAEGSIVLGNGVVYAGSRDANLYALDAGDGTPLWRFRTGGSVWNPGLAGQTLLVPSADQHVYALDLQASANSR